MATRGLTRIDLRRYSEPILSFCQDGASLFKRSHSELLVSCVALYVFPYTRVAGLCFDTLSNSKIQVAKWKSKGWFGEDAHGRFNESPEDFAFPDFLDFQFHDFPDLYECGDLEIVDLDGIEHKVIRSQTGDEGINHALFPSLCQILRRFEWRNHLDCENVTRAGVAMHDSECTRFWQID